MQSKILKAILMAAAVAAPSYAQVPGAGANPVLRSTDLQKPQVVTADQKLEALAAKVAALETKATELQNRANIAASANAELLTQNVNQTKEINSLKSELANLRIRFEDHQHYYEGADAGGKVRHAPTSVPQTSCDPARAKHGGDFKYCYASPAGSYEHGQ